MVFTGDGCLHFYSVFFVLALLFISLLTSPVWSPMLPMFSTSALHVPVRVMSKPGTSCTCVSPEPGADERVKKSGHNHCT